MGHVLNTCAPIFLVVFGNVTLSSLLHPKNARVDIVVIKEGTDILRRVEPMKASRAMSVRLVNSIISSNVVIADHLNAVPMEFHRNGIQK